MHAADITVVESLQLKAEQLKLWQEHEWINLLHYKKTDDDRYISQVDDLHFFNSKNGRTNSKDELRQTLAAFFKLDKLDDSHAQCKFVARLKWLQSKLNLDISMLPKVDCKAYLKWRDIIPDQRVSLVFPAYHLNSPSSMFGHTLLRLDRAVEDNSSDWLSMAVNFGANIRDDDDSLSYAFKGLSGGYPGFFIVTPYFNKIKEYNGNEKRDIWEYSLNLTPSETQRMVEHLWELKEIEFEYYFFDENCSYRLLELLEVARPSVELTDKFSLTAIPVDTVREIERSGLIEGSFFRPSRETTLKHLIQTVPEKNIDLVIALSKNSRLLNSKRLKALPESEQAQIIHVAYKYLRQLQIGQERKAGVSKESHALLDALAEFEIEKVNVPVPQYRPENGHYSNRLSLGLGEENKQKISELSFKLSFHSIDDNPRGYLQGAQINFGNFTVRSEDNENLKLQQFDVIDIFSITPRNNFFTPLSWKVYTGMERVWVNQRQQLVTHVTGGIGMAYNLIDNNLVYALIIGRLENNRKFDDLIVPAYGLSVGMLHHFESSTASFEVSGEEFTNGVFRYRSQYVHNFILDTQHSLKITAVRKRQRFIALDEMKLSYQYYFY